MLARLYSNVTHSRSLLPLFADEDADTRVAALVGRRAGPRRRRRLRPGPARDGAGALPVSTR